MDERRGSRRQKSFLRGVVYFDRGRGVMSCLVRDFSEEGARIILSETIILPDSVKLHIPQRDQTHDARVQWRRGDEIGLAFTDVKPAGAVSAQEKQLIERVAQLEGEIAALQRTIKRLKRDKSADGEIEAA
jgi:PilZ domain